MLRKVVSGLLALVLCICIGSAAEAKKKGSPRSYNTSWYGLHDESGKRTASGARFSPYAMIIAHRTLRFGTRVLFLNAANGKRACGTVRDRGPFTHRTWDVSYVMAVKLGFAKNGVANLRASIGGC
jgi:rare lipoprotein A